jgi:hypothetical protein
VYAERQAIPYDFPLKGVTQMKMLKLSAIGCLFAVLALLSAAPVSAQILTKSSGSYQDQLTRCYSWWECYKQQQIEKEKAAAEAAAVPPYVPLATPTIVIVPLVPILPNLVPTDSDARFYGGSLQIKAQVFNYGEADAQGFDFKVDVTFIRGDTGAVTGGTSTVSAFISHLGAGADWDDVLGYISPPDRNFDYDVVMNVLADSTNAQNGGAIWESNEQDNTLSVTCE